MSARGPAPAPAQLAKAALRRLALAQAEPTPENYARAYDEELGIAPRPVLPARSRAALERMAAALLRDEVQRAALVEAFVSAQPGLVERIVARVAADEANQAQALAGLFRGLVRGLERADRHWTLARKKEGLRGIFESSHGDAQRLQQRLSQLVAAWERDTPPNTAPAELPDAAPPPAADAPVGGDGFLATLGGALSRALPTDDASGRTLARCCSSSGNSAATPAASATAWRAMPT